MLDEVFITQQTFRILMNAMANPGRFYNMKNEDSISTLQKICLTLLDHEVKFSFVGEKVKEEKIKKILALTGSNYTSVEEADYVIICGKANESILLNVKTGTLEEPESGATLIYDIEESGKDLNVKLRISGPGIKDFMMISLKGVNIEELEVLKKINSNFPLGVDIIFCYKYGVICLPRSTNIEIM